MNGPLGFADWWHLLAATVSTLMIIAVLCVAFAELVKGIVALIDRINERRKRKAWARRIDRAYEAARRR